MLATFWEPETKKATGRPYWAHYIIIDLIYKQIVPTGLIAA